MTIQEMKEGTLRLKEWMRKISDDRETQERIKADVDMMKARPEAHELPAQPTVPIVELVRLVIAIVEENDELKARIMALENRDRRP